jgi:hypothetical protein
LVMGPNVGFSLAAPARFERLLHGQREESTE